MALKSCTEIGSARTLYQFMIDLQRINDSIPSEKNSLMIAGDTNFQRFLNNVIVCTEQDYDEQIFKQVA